MATISRKNPRVQQARALARDTGERTAQGVFLVEGPKLVREALAARMRLREVFVSPALLTKPAGEALRNDIASGGGEVLEVDERTLGDVSSVETAQGVVAIVEIPKYAGVDGLLAGTGDLLLLATVQDPGNAGALVRIAAAAGFAGVIADRATADFFSPKAVRGSAGSVMRLPVFRVDDLAEIAKRLASSGVAVLGAAARGGANVASMKLPPRIALVAGGEGRGIPDALAAACSGKVTIPMSAGVESLNVASAAAVLAFAIRARRAS